MQNSNDYDHILGDAVMDKFYNLKMADESIYSYLGATAVPLFVAYIHPDDRKIFTDAVERAKEESCEVYVTIRLKGFTGQYCVILIFIRQSNIDDGQFFDLNMYDIVYLVKAYEEVKAQARKVKMTMQLMNPGLLFDYTPETDEIRVFSDRDVVSFQGKLGDLHKHLFEKKLIDDANLGTLNRIYESMKGSSESLNCVVNMGTFSKDGSLRPVTVKTTSIMDKDNSRVVSVVGLVAPADEVPLSLDPRYSKSNLDPLTGLYNKAAIKDLAVESLAQPHKSITYAMLDLDCFKEVNDTYGHMFGDEVILNVARIIREVVGNDGYVGRVGGDEFFMVLFDMGTELNELRPILRSIRSQIEWAYKGRLGGIRLTASIGCASYGKDADNYDDLFKLADHSLYCAKQKGRDRFVIYTPELHGTLDSIKSKDNSINIDKSMSQREKLGFVLDAVNRLTDWRKEVINSVLTLMTSYFAINEAYIYDVKTGKSIYSNMEIAQEPEENVCNYLDHIRASFMESNTLVYCDYFNLKVLHPQFYDYMDRSRYFSVFIYAVKKMGEITHLITFYAKDHYEKWSETDQYYFSIICKIIGDKI